MVDLVKIRKKKAKQQETAIAAAESPRPTPPPEARSGAETSKKSEVNVPPLAQTQDPGLRTQDSVSKLDRFKSEAGKRRATEAVRVDDVATQDVLELLTFLVAGEQYAVDIERIVEIVTPRPITRIPNADASVVGIISLRGTIVTLVDVRRKLRHLESGEPTAETRIVVIDYHHEIVGFVVDRVLRVVKTAAADVERHPVVHSNELDESIRGVFRASGALTILLDLDKLLDHGVLTARTA
jgi:purine-binding chemotaxis protein CheW